MFNFLINSRHKLYRLYIYLYLVSLQLKYKGIEILNTSNIIGFYICMGIYYFERIFLANVFHDFSSEIPTPKQWV